MVSSVPKRKLERRNPLLGDRKSRERVYVILGAAAPSPILDETKALSEPRSRSLDFGRSDYHQQLNHHFSEFVSIASGVGIQFRELQQISAFSICFRTSKSGTLF